MSDRTERVEFEGAEDVSLAGRLEHPQGTPRGWALFAHCFTCSKETHAATRVSRALAGRGFATLRFDFTGLGESEGDFSDSTFSTDVRDLIAACDFMSDRYDLPGLAVGHSLGGAAVLLAAGKIESVDAVATIGAPCDPEHVRHLFDDAIEKIKETGEAEVTLAGRRFRIRQQFLDDLSEQAMQEQIGELDRPLLVFHSPIDSIVGIDNAARIYRAAKHPKSFVSLDDADHLLTREADADYVGTVLSAWGSRYLDESTEEAEQPPAPLGEGDAVVAETGPGDYSQDVWIGRHHLRADEPTDVGGDDTGPSPYGYIVGGLGACTSITLRMYADRKDWPVEQIEVRLHHDKIYAEDCESCDQDSGKIDKIERLVHIEGDLTDEQRDRMIEIADKCPVHETLTRENQVVTKLAGSSG